MTPARFYAQSITASLAFDPARPSASIEEGLRQIASLLQSGASLAQLDLRGTATVYVEGRPHAVRLYTKRTATGTTLLADRRDLRWIITRMERPTAWDLDIAARYPTRAGKLLQIKSYAENTSRNAAQHDRSIAEDSYRHVLWSYLMTREFGAEFAQEVTDAHETGAFNESASDRALDLINNDLGRRYAAQGLPESELADKLRGGAAQGAALTRGRP